MTDIVSKEKRSIMMAGIRSTDTKPEILLRRLLHRNGYRFRLHAKDLPGTPDIVLPKWKTVVFVNGCFWHGHHDCHLYRPPKSKRDFWEDKIKQNRVRDARISERLITSGWKTIIVWECAISKKHRLPENDLATELDRKIKKSEEIQVYEIRGPLQLSPN